jgi:hypothetical protein
VLNERAAKIYTDNFSDAMMGQLNEVQQLFFTHFTTSEYPNPRLNPETPLPEEWIPYALLMCRDGKCKPLSPPPSFTEAFTEFYYSVDGSHLHPLEFQDLDTPQSVPDNRCEEVFEEKHIRQETLRNLLIECMNAETTGAFRKVAARDVLDFGDFLSFPPEPHAREMVRYSLTYFLIRVREIMYVSLFGFSVLFDVL